MTELPTMAPLRFTLSEDLVVKAAILNSSRYYVRFLVFCVAVGVATSIFFMVRRSTWQLSRELPATLVVITGTVAMGLVMIALMRYLVYPQHARRNFRQQKALSDEMTLSWADRAFTLTTGGSRTEMPFANLHGYAASRKIVLLYVSDALYYVIPLDAFGGGETAEAFRRELEQAGVKRL